MSTQAAAWSLEPGELRCTIPARKRPHVLLAEDRPDNAEYALQALQHLSCVVQLAATGTEAVSRAVSGHFDLILMDSHLPEITGCQAIRLIRLKEAISCDHATPIVMVTASLMQDEVTEYWHAGASDVLPKPFSLLQLARKVARWTVDAEGRS